MPGDFFNGKAEGFVGICVSSVTLGLLYFTVMFGCLLVGPDKKVKKCMVYSSSGRSKFYNKLLVENSYVAFLTRAVADRMAQ